jgi:hypothetical protein
VYKYFFEIDENKQHEINSLSEFAMTSGCELFIYRNDENENVVLEIHMQDDRLAMFFEFWTPFEKLQC